MSKRDELLTFSEHMKRLRARVDPKNCARSHEQASKAAQARWTPEMRAKRAVLAAMKTGGRFSAEDMARLLLRRGK
jgi:hypothetical protein